MGELTFWNELDPAVAHQDGPAPDLRPRRYFSVYKVVLQKSILVQIRQLILYISDSRGQVDGFVGDLTFWNELDPALAHQDGPAPDLRTRRYGSLRFGVRSSAFDISILVYGLGITVADFEFRGLGLKV